MNYDAFISGFAQENGGVVPAGNELVVDPAQWYKTPIEVKPLQERVGDSHRDLMVSDMSPFGQLRQPEKMMEFLEYIFEIFGVSPNDAGLEKRYTDYEWENDYGTIKDLLPATDTATKIPLALFFAGHQAEYGRNESGHDPDVGPTIEKHVSRADVEAYFQSTIGDNEPKESRYNKDRCMDAGINAVCFFLGIE